MSGEFSDPPAGEEWTVTARWIFPADGPPLHRGVLSVRDDRIVAVEAGGRRADLDLGNAALLPGLVNVHTHLDLSDAGGKCPPSPDFPGWLQSVGRHRREQSEGEVAQAIRAGIAECLRLGTTLVGDIAVRGQSWKHVSEAPLRSVVFYEMIGLPEGRARWGTGLTRDWLNDHPALETCRPAYSLHAPFSVRRTVFEELGAGVCAGRRYPIAIHVAETEAELELLASRSGAFVSFLEELGVWDPAGLVEDLESILKRDTPRSLFIHGNYLPSSAAIGQGTLVYCPRTHAAFGHGAHPFREFMKKGTRVVLATDSRASNPDLDVLAEACFVHERHQDIAGETLLRMITLSGAEALGWAEETGSLTAGKSADLVVLPLEDRERDPFELLWHSSCQARRTLFRGKWRHASRPGKSAAIPGMVEMMPSKPAGERSEPAG